MSEFKIGDKYYSVYKKCVFTIMAVEVYTKDTIFHINWQKYDHNRPIGLRWSKKPKIYDGTVSINVLKFEILCEKPIYKVKDDKHLLELMLKYA
jgi:hypothetical protein